MVNLELYKIFALVAREKNITKASEILHISQPAVTNHIKNLESDLNIKLFNRTNHGIELTEEGQKIYNEIEEPVSILENIYNKYGNVRNINLGIHVSMYKLFSRIITKFCAENENIKVNIHDTNLVNMLAPELNDMLLKLENEKLDLVISKKTNSYNTNKLEFIKLGELQDVLVTSNHSKYVSQTINIDLLKKVLLYMPRKGSITYNNFLNATQLTESELTNSKNITYNAMLELLQEQDSIGLITKEYIEKELNNNEVIELKTDFNIPEVEFGIYINKNNRFSELNKLINIIKCNSI